MHSTVCEPGWTVFLEENHHIDAYLRGVIQPIRQTGWYQGMEMCTWMEQSGLSLASCHEIYFACFSLSRARARMRVCMCVYYTSLVYLCRLGL